MGNWYGIESIKFIWHGEWADPEVCYNGMVVNAYIVENTMVEKYREYCEENNITPDELGDGFEQYMRDNSEEVKELIEIAYTSIQEAIDAEPKPSASVSDKIGEISLRICDIKTINAGGDVSEVCEQPYIQKQFQPFDTQLLVKETKYILDWEEEVFFTEVTRDEAIEELVKLTADQLSHKTK